MGRLGAELGLASPGLRAASQPCKLLAQQVLPAVLDGAGLTVALETLLNVGGVAALEGVDDTVVHLPHGQAHLVEKPPVVRDHEQGAGALRPAGVEVGGKPADGAHVEVVRGLVEGKDVPVAHKQARQVDATALAAGKRPHARVPGDVANESGDDGARLGVGGPLVLGGVSHDALPHRGVVGQGVLLPEHAHARAAPHGDAARVGLQESRDDVEQRRLAVAVLAHDTRAVALGDTQAEPGEHAAGGVFQTYVFAADENAHASLPFSEGIWPRCGR